MKSARCYVTSRGLFHIMTILTMIHWEQWVVMMATLSSQVTSHFQNQHYSDVIMGVMMSQVTSLTTVYSTADQRKHQSSTSLAFVQGIHLSPVNSPHKWPVMRKMFPFNDVIMNNDKVPQHDISMKKLIPWQHQTVTFSVSLALCAGNSPVTGEFPSQRPVTWSFDVFFDLCLKNCWANNRERERSRDIEIERLRDRDREIEREILSLSAFLGTEDIRVHIVHISRVIITYTLE